MTFHIFLVRIFAQYAINDLAKKDTAGHCKVWFDPCPQQVIHTSAIEKECFCDCYTVDLGRGSYCIVYHCKKCDCD